MRSTTDRARQMAEEWLDRHHQISYDGTGCDVDPRDFGAEIAAILDVLVEARETMRCHQGFVLDGQRLDKCPWCGKSAAPLIARIDAILGEGK